MTNRNRRALQWIMREQVNSGLASGAQDNLTLYSSAIHGNRFGKGATVTRLLVDIKLAAAVVAQRNRFYWGIVVMNADARAAGAFPDPEDETDRPSWLARGRMEVVQDSLSDASQWDRALLDLRSQRIIRNEEDELQLVVTNGATGFTAPLLSP